MACVSTRYPQIYFQENNAIVDRETVRQTDEEMSLKRKFNDSRRRKVGFDPWVGGDVCIYCVKGPAWGSKVFERGVCVCV
jgi:hypothetical protein